MIRRSPMHGSRLPPRDARGPDRIERCSRQAARDRKRAPRCRLLPLRPCLALKRQHVFDQWQDVAARLRAPWMRCCRQADGLRRPHLGAVVLTHGLVVPIVVVAVPGHRYKILVECDEEVPLSSDADGRRRAVHAKCVALAVQVRRRRRLVRTSRSGSDRLMQGVVLITEEG